MFVNMSIKMLILGPLTRSIICHYNLFLVRKQSMTGIILTFPGMQPPGNETKMSVHIDPTSMMGGARVSTLHCGAVNNLLSLWTVLCWLIMIQAGIQVAFFSIQGIHHFCLHPSLPFSTTALRPAAWTCPAAPELTTLA